MPSSAASPCSSARGLSERDAIARANLYAALSTTGVGTQKSFVTRQRFEDEWQTRQAAEPLANP